MTSEIEKKTHELLKAQLTNTSPLLLAFSGGVDSLVLFHLLLSFRKAFNIPFYVAHVDHGWRKESAFEAEQLRSYCKERHVPFYLKTLDPSLIKGNLENECRKQRYAFFSSLAEEKSCQLLLTAHHKDDSIETVLKRFFEGSHWQKWDGIAKDSLQGNMRILRPLLDFAKEEILSYAASNGLFPIDDKTNDDTLFLRARMRHELLPLLSKTYGKEIKNNLLYAARQSNALKDYFFKKISPYLSTLKQGPFGSWISTTLMPLQEPLEAEFLIREFLKIHHFSVSREIIEKASLCLVQNKSNVLFEKADKKLIIDRGNLFLTEKTKPKQTGHIPVQEGLYKLENWSIQIKKGTKKEIYDWKAAWSGKVYGWIPLALGEGSIIHFIDPKNPQNAKLSKKWCAAKVPAFLRCEFPIVSKNAELVYEFLAPKPSPSNQEEEGWIIEGLNLFPAS